MSVLVEREKHKLRAFEENMDYFQDHYEELKKKYPNEYVAINDGDVIDHDCDPDALMDRLHNKYQDIGTFVVEPIIDKKIKLVL